MPELRESEIAMDASELFTGNSMSSLAFSLFRFFILIHIVIRAKKVKVPLTKRPENEAIAHLPDVCM